MITKRVGSHEGGRNKNVADGRERERDGCRIRAETELRNTHETSTERVKENQVKSGLGAGRFCQHNLSVTMVTMQRSDVISSNGLLVIVRIIVWGCIVRLLFIPSNLFYPLN